MSALDMDAAVGATGTHVARVLSRLQRSLILVDDLGGRDGNRCLVRSRCESLRDVDCGIDALLERFQLLPHRLEGAAHGCFSCHVAKVLGVDAF